MRAFRWMLWGILALFSTAVGYAQAPPLSYSTNFPVTENPISEGSRWINGRAVGLNWADVRVTSGLAFVTESGNSGFDDSTAVLTGNWNPDQMAQGTVHTVNQDSSIFEEVELRLRTSISANSITGYEINFRCTADGNQYVQIVRWNGPLGDFTYVDSRMGPGIHDGDVVKATIIGDTITAYVNGIEVFHGTDSVFSSGSPGIGFYLDSGSGVNSDYGFTSFTASDIGSSNFGSSAQPNSTILRGDFNGDGKNDILWQNTDGSTAMWLMNGLNVISSGGLLGPGSGWSIQQVGDFNGDGKSDILWLNTDGSTAMWLMNGLTVISGGGLLGPGTGWSVKKIGDFNGDGMSDILWQNIDGSAAIWLMNGLSVLSGGGLMGPASGWTVTNIGDFNGDGKSDIIWQNLNGSAAIWIMNGLTVTSGGGLIGPASGWSVVQIGDFNGDSKSDIVWQHTDGSSSMWLMNGVSVIGSGGLIGPSTGWSVRKVGDFNGDLKADLVWQNIDGRVAVCLMNGATTVTVGDILGPNTGWSVNRLGDFNSDGLSDIVWMHTNGSSAIWLMNGVNFSSGGSLLGSSTGWSPAP
jgi:hypothetical protein